MSSADNRAEKFADVNPLVSDNGYWRGNVWRMGGHINGSAQPFKILDAFEGSETEVRAMIEGAYPGIAYAPLPEVIEGRLYV